MSASPTLDFQYATGTIIDAPAHATGYGRMGAEMAVALTESGVELTEESDTRLIASNLTGITGWWTHQRPLVWTMWESDRLPPSFKGWFDRFERLLVPSAQNVELFSEHHPDVHLMPLGLHNRWQPIIRNLTGPVKVLLSGRGWKRKGVDLAIAALERTGLEVELWLRMEGRPENDELQRLKHHPMVRLVPRVDDETWLYTQCHICLAPSRGEGWGMVPLQAMATGMPTVLTDAHGHAEFAEYATGPVPAIKVPSGMEAETGHWWEPRLTDLTTVLEDHLSNLEYWTGVAMDRAPAIGAAFAWDPARLMDLVGPTKRVEHKGWFEPWSEPKVWPCTARRRVRADIGGTDIVIAEGETQMMGWDVYRVLRDNDAIEAVA